MSVANLLPDAATTAAGPFSPARSRAPSCSPRVVVRGLVALTKPRIIELLLVTTVPTMLLAQHGLPSLRLVLVTLAGGTLAAGSANTINCYIDRDIDAVMRRTSQRPLVVNHGQGTIRLFHLSIAYLTLLFAAVAVTAVLPWGR